MTHFTILIPSYNNIKWIYRTLYSALYQRYNNFDVIYLDDMSDDGTYEYVVDNFKNFKNLSIVRNNERKLAVKNIYDGVRLVKDDSVVIILDGDDQLKNDGVLYYLSNVYKDVNIWMTYGSFEIKGKKSHFLRSHTKEEIESNSFRDVPWVASHLRTFRKELYLKIDEEDLKDENGDFYKITGDLAIQYPMLEMAGHHSLYIPHVLYIYNNDNPISDDKQRELQLKMEKEIRGKKKYNKIESL